MDQISSTVGHTNTFYHPNCGDVVIGIIDKRVNDDWSVDIGFSHMALLNMLSFDGATKRNCPKFKRGEVVAAFVEEVPDAGEVLLSCKPRTKKETLGQLAGGTIIRSRPRDLQKIADLGLLKMVSEKTSTLKCSFGKNGRLYIDTGNAVTSVLAANAIMVALENKENPEEELSRLLNNIDFQKYHSDVSENNKQNKK